MSRVCILHSLFRFDHHIRRAHVGGIGPELEASLDRTDYELACCSLFPHSS